MRLLRHAAFDHLRRRLDPPQRRFQIEREVHRIDLLDRAPALDQLDHPRLLTAQRGLGDAAGGHDRRVPPHRSETAEVGCPVAQQVRTVRMLAIGAHVSAHHGHDRGVALFARHHQAVGHADQHQPIDAIGKARCHRRCDLVAAVKAQHVRAFDALRIQEFHHRISQAFHRRLRRQRIGHTEPRHVRRQATEARSHAAHQRREAPRRARHLVQHQ